MMIRVTVHSVQINDMIDLHLLFGMCFVPVFGFIFKNDVLCNKTIFSDRQIVFSSVIGKIANFQFQSILFFLCKTKMIPRD